VRASFEVFVVTAPLGICDRFL